MGRGAEMARKGTFRAVVAVLLGLLAALCLLSLAAAQARNEVPTIVENECTKPKKKCGVCRYQYVAPEIPPVGPTPKSPPPPVVTLIPPPPPKVNPVPETPVDGDGARDGD